MLFACSLVAKAQFANPFEYDNGKGISYQVSVVAFKGEETVKIPQDTIMETNQIGLLVLGKFRPEKQTENKDSVLYYTLNGQVKDYYKRNIDKKDFSVTMAFINDNMPTIPGGGESNSAMQVGTTEIGGHFYWEWTDSLEKGVGQKGHIQMNMKPVSEVYGKNGNVRTQLKEYSQLDIYTTIKTGFPYDIANYQGVTKYTVYAPDSSIICTKNIPLRMSADSTMNGQIQEDLICTVDSARKGNYKVVIDGPFLEKPVIWRIEVVDPLENASSQNPADATYRLIEPDFKNEGKGKGWKRQGNINPTYYNELNGDTKYSAMVVRTQGYEGNGFSLSQTVDKMPQGYYKLTWPVIYQPCAYSKLGEEAAVLADLEANGFSVKAKHILSGAAVTVPKDAEEGYIALKLPQSDKAFANSLYYSYQNEITFQVKEDSLISIGVHKSHGTLDHEVTAIGCPTLKYYGAGLPYGVVSFEKDSLYAVGDSIKLEVGLYDGLGKKVAADNTIDMVICKKMADGNFDTENPIISKQMNAPKQDIYDLFIELPEDAKQLPDGNYLLLVASLKDGNDYLLLESKNIEVNNASAINEVIAEPTANTAKGNADKNTYNLAGMKVSNSNQAKGIYIKGKKKVARR